MLFAAENIVLMCVLSMIQKLMAKQGLHYFVILVTIVGIYGIVMLLLNGKRFLGALKEVNVKNN